MNFQRWNPEALNLEIPKYHRNLHLGAALVHLASLALP